MNFWNASLAIMTLAYAFLCMKEYRLIKKHQRLININQGLIDKYDQMMNDQTVIIKLYRELTGNYNDSEKLWSLIRTWGTPQEIASLPADERKKVIQILELL